LVNQFHLVKYFLLGLPFLLVNRFLLVNHVLLEPLPWLTTSFLVNIFPLG
jgi:hypothetical protein